MEASLQETYAPENMCFGCGPKNAKGLRLASFPDGEDACVCHWKAQPHHQAFPGMLNGGICGALLDCHSNWTAAWHLMRKAGQPSPPCTVTAEFHVKLKRPTPLDADLTLRAHVSSNRREDRATVEATIEANGKVTATCRGVFRGRERGAPRLSSLVAADC